MKTIVLLIIFYMPILCFGQSVGIGTNAPDASAMLDVNSTSRGLLIPRMTELQKSQINQPATGLLIWQTDDTPGFYYNSGTPEGPKWFMLSVADNNWLLNGNAGTNPSNFLGTTDNQPFRLRVRNVWAGSIDSAKGTYIGFKAGQYDIMGNVAFGDMALSTNETGVGITAFGRLALEKNKSANANTAIGSEALRENTSGFSNTALGTQAMVSNTTGNQNVAVGMLSMYENKGSANVGIGVYSLSKNEGSDNVGIGYYALRDNTSGHSNVAVGGSALRKNTTGNRNIALGSSALLFCDTAIDNIAIGASALAKNKVDNNTAVGSFSQQENVVGMENTSLGYRTLSSNVNHNGNTAVGFESQISTIAHYNTSIGSKSLQANTTGLQNVAVGFSTMRLNTEGELNTSIGAYALGSNISGNYNTAVGNTAGFGSESGDYNTFLGYRTAVQGVRTFANAIGTRAYAECSNCLILGSVDGKNSATSTVNVGIGTTNPLYRLQVGTAGDGSQARANAWNTFSDARYKTNIEEIPNALEKVEHLHGYYYYWKNGSDGTRQAGLMAQEIEEVMPEIVSTDSDGYKSVDYGKMNALLLQAVKEQQIAILQLQADNLLIKQALEKATNKEKRTKK